MNEPNRVSRRRALALSGSALSVAVAGCTGSRADGDSGDADGQILEREDWEDIEEIELEGYMSGWVGVAPDLIAGIRNPSLLLFEGNDYEITWENADNAPHNIAIRNAENRVVDGNRTSNVRERGQTQTLAFEATETMHEYVCEPHPRSMIGYLRVDE
ncbi:hypothetical protein GS429_09110 [Natronorubrum sp. JWXQ-INN-674]|uniref:Blue (type 1) copper domain-containing protein n=1 Tax=Natronorubrum halalkaliphilum TaxID=2691917 RepID=A0A6B0VMF2_9EURY|nr:plastocyanin/azurin family copper-binding protein [Natronorubrum halalkaliphilum]MXV62216.1 hypothetical protein [Natronorubrum halalkaliphilum]